MVKVYKILFFAVNNTKTIHPNTIPTLLAEPSKDSTKWGELGILFPKGDIKHSKMLFLYPAGMLTGCSIDPIVALENCENASTVGHADKGIENLLWGTIRIDPLREWVPFGS